MMDHAIIVHVTSSSPKSLHLEKNWRVGFLQCWIGGRVTGQPQLLPKMFQVLPTSCNEPEVQREMNDNRVGTLN